MYHRVISIVAFAAPRNPGVGSPFIRALVATLYTLGHRHDVVSLAEIVSLA
jgi:hypothetical protein